MENREMNQEIQNKSLPKLSSYTDFRQYLKDYYNYQKQVQRGYTYSVFSARADIKSPNYLKLVIDGKRNLSEDMILKFSRALDLDKIQIHEFQALVRYGQAVNNDERNLLLRKLSEYRVKQQIARGEIKQEVWEQIPSWVSWVLYEMADQAGVDFNSPKITEIFHNKVKMDDVKIALQKLLASGELIQDTETGEIRKTTESTKNREDIPVALVKKLQSELMQLGLESLYNDSPTERETSALTLCMNQEEFEKMRFELRQLRKRYHRDIAVARSQAKGERVYQFNIQLFPLTEKAKQN